ncbi:hypothetical protein BJ165DRAFT_629868 [Panaeolus papilionaceus]|nr:hypothetical protein BJ165DRAFT_629868 [Panaeolus papilionaceus]
MPRKVQRCPTPLSQLNLTIQVKLLWREGFFDNAILHAVKCRITSHSAKYRIRRAARFSFVDKYLSSVMRAVNFFLWSSKSTHLQPRVAREILIAQPFLTLTQPPSDTTMSSHFDDELEREFEINGERGPEEHDRAESTPPGPIESSATEEAPGVDTGATAASTPLMPSQPTGDIFSERAQLFMSLMNSRSPAGAHVPPAVTPGEMLHNLRNMFNNMTSNLNTLIPHRRNVKIPTSTLPTYVNPQRFGATPGGSITINDFIDSTRDVFDFAQNAINMLNAIKSSTRPPPPSPIPTTSSRESLQPRPISPEPVVTEGDTRPVNVMSLMSESLTRGFQQNESLLRSTLSRLGTHILSLPENHPTYNLLQSVSGLMNLHLYEVTWEKKHLDSGVMVTSLAWSKLEDPKNNFEKVPTLLRNWSYSQRLLAQDTGDGDKLTVPCTLLEEVYKVAKDMEVIPDRVKEFLRHELACCLYDRYLLLGDLPCLDATIEHFQAICEGGAASANKTCQFGLAHLHRFYASGNLDDLDKALHHATVSAGMQSAANLPDPTMDFDQAAGLHLFSLCLEQKFYLQLDLTYLDQAISKCRAALPMLREENPFFVRCKCDLASLLLLRFQSCGDRADLNVAEEELLTALVTETPERNTQTPVRTLLGFVQTIKAENPSEMDEGIQLLLKSRKDYSGPLYIESRIEELVSRAHRHRYNTTPAPTTSTEDLHSALHHARLALDKCHGTSPRCASLALDVGQLLMMIFKLDPDVKLCTEAISMFSSAAKAPSGLATTKLRAAKEWADAAEVCHSETLIDALECGLHLLPTIAWVGNSMPIQYRVLSSQSSVLASRAAAYAIERGELEKAVAYLEMGRNVLWTQALQFHPRGKGDKHLAEMDEKEYLADYLSRQLHEDVNEINAEQMGEAMEHLTPAFFDLLRSLQGLGRFLEADWWSLWEKSGRERI